ncbi:MAG: SRPBCC family protein, partial [Actinomycetota bacterium]
RAMHFGIPFRMTSKITAFDRPRSFIDQQLSGPFASFVHLHTFEPVGDGTRMTDQISFRSPLGPLGALVNRALLTRYLTNLIAMRNQQIKAEAERRSS